MRFSFTVPGEPQGKARARTWFDPRVGKAVSKTPEDTVAMIPLSRWRLKPISPLPAEPPRSGCRA